MGDNHTCRTQRGFGLIEVIISMSLLSLIAAVASKIIRNSQLAASKVGVDLGAVGAAAKIIDSVSCPVSFPAGSPVPPCAPGSPVQLLLQDGRPLVRIPAGTGAASGAPTADYTEIGATGSSRFQLRAICRAGGVELEAQHVAGQGATARVLPDVVTGKVHSFGSAQAVIARSLCSASFVPLGAGFQSCEGNTYLSGIDYENRRVNCSAMPECAADESLRMVSGVYTCVSNRNIARQEADVVRREMIPRISDLSTSATTLESETTTLNTTATNLNTQTNSLESRLAALINLVNNVNGELAQANAEISLSSYRITNLGRGPTAEVTGRSDEQCASLSRMTCPDGYMMWSYEARFPGTDNTCRIMCRRLLP